MIGHKKVVLKKVCEIEKCLPEREESAEGSRRAWTRYRILQAMPYPKILQHLKDLRNRKQAPVQETTAHVDAQVLAEMTILENSAVSTPPIMDLHGVL